MKNEGWNILNGHLTRNKDLWGQPLRNLKQDGHPKVNQLYSTSCPVSSVQIWRKSLKPFSLNHKVKWDAEIFGQKIQNYFKMGGYEAKCPQKLHNAHKFSYIKSQQNRFVTFGVIAKIVKLHVKWRPFFKMAGFMKQNVHRHCLMLIRCHI